MYAKADLYGMGKGIFPKDKVPTLPVHPNCMCRLIPVYEGSPRLKSETPKDRKLDGGMEYIKQLPEVRQKSLLGINGLQMVKRGADWRQYARGYSDKVMTSRIVVVQEYRAPEYGEKRIGIYKGKKVQIRPVTNFSYDLSVSTNVSLKPKMLWEAGRQIRESIKLIGVEDTTKLPKFAVLSNDEIDGALGRYEPITNQLSISPDILQRGSFAKYLKLQENTATTNPLITMVHELYHWKDAQDYIKRYGGMDADYIKHIRAVAREKIDSLIRAGYDVASISQYAIDAFNLGKYDEVFTEYRVHELLERGRGHGKAVKSQADGLF